MELKQSLITTSKYNNSIPYKQSSYTIKDLLSKQCRKVLTHDPYVKNDLDLVSLQVILENADILVIGAPHNIYKTVLTSKPIIDVWNLLKRGSTI
jgi:UDP-N-acetyl-D-mannosaminuronic acid dehydrogenase